MKIKNIIISSLSILIIGIVIILTILLRPLNVRQDTVLINEITVDIINNTPYEEMNYDLAFTVLDINGDIIYQNDYDMSRTLNEAYINYDTVITLNIEDTTNYLIIKNNSEKVFNNRITAACIVGVSVLIIEFLILIGHTIYLKKNIIKPFRKLEVFASEVASGNLNAFIDMDKKNIFGALTESFLVMRDELEKARIAEFKLNEEKKELVAKLSHDIKTPIASIVSSAELGLVKSSDKEISSLFLHISDKGNQINILASNLLNSTIEELTTLEVHLEDYPSHCLAELIDKVKRNDDISVESIPSCLLSFDKVRLNQVLENIFSNSYKYANTHIDVSFVLNKKYLDIRIRDYGSGVLEEELDKIMGKFSRGSNSFNIEGSGLGLYISKELMELMHGKIKVSNKNPGFETLISLPLSGIN